jgi:hypothetical protein
MGLEADGCLEVDECLEMGGCLEADDCLRGGVFGSEKGNKWQLAWQREKARASSNGA